MNYKVLYRKYRPDNFDNIIGQDYVIRPLKNSIIHNNIAHAYIFSGPRGTGKTSTAKVFAKAINCLNPKDGSPCNECEFCTNFHENPDIIEIDAASNNGVDQIRSLIDNIKLTPTNGKYKVYIIDEVHMLTISAFNALLLTLEEPPKHAIFILATTNIENVPVTILSRCQRFDFQKIQITDIINRLTEICKLENINITTEAITEVAYLAEGGMRDALSLLDQLSKSGEEITLEFVENQVKTISQKSLKLLMESIEKNNVDDLLKIINDYRENSVNYKYLVKKLVETLSNNAKKLKTYSSSSRLDYDNYKRVILELTDSLNKININVDSYIILEMILLSLFDTKNVTTKEDTVVKKIEEKKVENLEKNIELSPKKNDFDDTELVKVRVNNCFVDAQKQYLEEFRNSFKEYIESTNIVQKFKAILLDSNLIAASSEYLIITCENEFIANKNNSLLEELEQDYYKFSKKKVKIIFLGNDKWLKFKQEYINNLKNGYKYNLIEEIMQKQNDSEINSVFDVSKVEII